MREASFDKQNDDSSMKMWDFNTNGDESTNKEFGKIYQKRFHDFVYQRRKHTIEKKKEIFSFAAHAFNLMSERQYYENNYYKPEERIYHMEKGFDCLPYFNKSHNLLKNN